MKTKYILHGGFNKVNGPVQENDEFFREMLNIGKDNVKVLLVYFAESPEKIEMRIEQDCEQLTKNQGSKKLDIRIASEESFISDCQWADVVYLHGGRTVRLMAVLDKFNDLEEVFSCKVIAGDSAGANALGKLFYSKSSGEIGEGLGILPNKILVHYVDGAPDPLADKLPELETIILHEYEFKVIDK